MKTTAEQHIRIVRHLMEFAGLGARQAEFVAVEAWAAVAPIVEDALSAERDTLRSLLAASENVRRACDERMNTQRSAIERLVAERDELREALRAALLRCRCDETAHECDECIRDSALLSRPEATQPAPARVPTMGDVIEVLDDGRWQRTEVTGISDTGAPFGVAVPGGCGRFWYYPQGEGKSWRWPAPVRDADE